LADPEQSDGEREEANDQQQSGHGFPLLLLWHRRAAAGCPLIKTIARPTRSSIEYNADAAGKDEITGVPSWAARQSL
jgi:hypothetical protein